MYQLQPIHPINSLDDPPQHPWCARVRSASHLQLSPFPAAVESKLTQRPSARELVERNILRSSESTWYRHKACCHGNEWAASCWSLVVEVVAVCSAPIAGHAPSPPLAWYSDWGWEGGGACVTKPCAAASLQPTPPCPLPSSRRQSSCNGRRRVISA